MANNVLVGMQTTLRFVRSAQLKRDIFLKHRGEHETFKDADSDCR